MILKLCAEQKDPSISADAEAAFIRELSLTSNYGDIDDNIKPVTASTGGVTMPRATSASKAKPSGGEVKELNRSASKKQPSEKSKEKEKLGTGWKAGFLGKSSKKKSSPSAPTAGTVQSATGGEDEAVVAEGTTGAASAALPAANEKAVNTAFTGMVMEKAPPPPAPLTGRAVGPPPAFSGKIIER